ncbi:MAG TPA: penicillin acylase family protein [Vicinamibacterales bacterium]|nr:penicillin acylase family protein [Vicinamibacterales bacterium]
MKKIVLALVLACASWRGAAAADPQEIARWQKQAQGITITRDDWGIAHVHGKTDTDAVFGAIYAQAEDDFNRVELNFINGIGRLAEAEGEKEIYRDLRQKLFIDPVEMKKIYTGSPAWLKKLMDGWADGLNFYLYKHPETKPRVITHFEPWMALTFSEGSIGGDIERVNLKELEAFYGNGGAKATADRLDARAASEIEPSHDYVYVEPTGSNGAAVAPSNTAGHHALLLINPHTSFFFRSELQMTSDEGLNAYGASTWGQFFIYQGFNDRVGWMHTSSGVDAIDEYLETIVKKGDKYFYKVGADEKPMIVRTIKVPYKTDRGMAEKTFVTYRTHRGPVVRSIDGKWVSVRMMEEPMKALMQSYQRTKARNIKDYEETMAIHTNSSNNTLYADKDGNIAMFYANFVPRRDERFDWTKPVDGSDPATEWKGLLSFDESPNVVNPSVGWVFNTNDWPWSAAGPDSPKRDKFPKYIERNGENPRGPHAIEVLSKKKDFTVDSLIAAAFDSHLTQFEIEIPALLKAYDSLPATSRLKGTDLNEAIAMLRAWNRRWAVDSIPTSIAVFWGEEVARPFGDAARKAGMSADDYAAQHATPEQMLTALQRALDKLEADFDTWKTPWGEINRFQRLTADIVQPFDDSKPSIPVGFTSSRWGSLASFGARPYNGTKKWYGTTGNSFVAVVEFGDRVRARAVTAGGESGHVGNKHFNDEAERYATGNLREVYFYPDQLKGHSERVYHPGE